MMALSVALGAFGAHGLKKIIDHDMLTIYQTGVQYQFYHSLGLILIGLISTLKVEQSKMKLAGWTMFAGIILFSGSLYILSITGIKIVGAITPIGGVSFILSWIFLYRSFKTI